MSHSRALIMETALANAVVENTKQFHGLYVPPFLKKGTFVFFAEDNIDFAEDTADGKDTTHGMVTAIYQRADTHGEPITPPLCVDYTKLESLHNPIPYTHATLSEAKAHHIPQSDGRVQCQQLWCGRELSPYTTRMGGCLNDL